MNNKPYRRHRPAVALLFAAFGLLVLLAAFWAGDVYDTVPPPHQYVVIPHTYVLVAAAVGLGVIALLYWRLPRLLKRPLNYTLGQLHFLSTAVCMVVVFYPKQYEGIAGTPRRYYDYTPHSDAMRFVDVNPVIFWAVVIGLLAQLLLLVNVIAAVMRGKGGRKAGF